MNGYIGVRPRLRSYLDAPNGRLEIRPVVIDDRNAPVAQVSRLKRNDTNGFFIAMLHLQTKDKIDKPFIYQKLFSFLLALYSMTKEKTKIEKREKLFL